VGTAVGSDVLVGIAVLVGRGVDVGGVVGVGNSPGTTTMRVASRTPAMIAITRMMPRITPPAMSTHPQPASPRLRGGSYAGGGGAAGGGACHGCREAGGEGIADPSGDSCVRHSTQKRAPASLVAPQFWQIMYHLQGVNSETASPRVPSIEQLILKCNYAAVPGLKQDLAQRRRDTRIQAWRLCGSA
jgi:hypothetical protein